MRKALLIGAFSALVAIPAYAATGKHIECHLDGVITLSNGEHEDASHTLRFYLDDANAKLVAENENLTAKTISFSDTEVNAEVQDNMSGFPIALFGNAADEPAFLRLLRTTGQIGLGAKLVKGADIELGTCTPIAPPKAKF